MSSEHIAGWLSAMSHPERLLAMAMHRAGYQWCIDSVGWVFLRKGDLVAIPQAPMVGGIQADYGFQRLDVPRRNLCVEIDGLKFHEKTQQQAAEDRRRSRALLARGVPTMRFMALEVMRDAGACLFEIERYILGDPSLLPAAAKFVERLRQAPVVECASASSWEGA